MIDHINTHSAISLMVNNVSTTAKTKVNKPPWPDLCLLSSSTLGKASNWDTFSDNLRSDIQESSSTDAKLPWTRNFTLVGAQTSIFNNTTASSP
jgi:hypothetical protein